MSVAIGNSVRALAVSSDGQLYAGGRFARADGLLVNNVAQWDGFSWYPLGQGTSAKIGNPLLAPPAVSALALSGGILYIGGNFTWVTNTFGTVPANCVARWDGFAWSPLGSGMSGYGTYTAVRALTVSAGGTLYAGGLFSSAGGLPANLIARWNSSSWSRLGSGISGNSFNGAAVSCLAVTDSSLFAGGYFTEAGGKICSYAAQAVLATPFIVSNDNNFGFTNGLSQFGFNISGGTLQSVVIQASTDLSDWAPVQTNVMSGPLLHFSDPAASSFPHRFYRVLLAR
jgi:hypothetical protein